MNLIEGSVPICFHISSKIKEVEIHKACVRDSAKLLI